MIHALVFKEWLKIRWAALILFGVFLLLMAKMTLNISYAIRIMGANNFWYEVITRSTLFFDDILYLPALTGAVIGAFQFFPEITEKRLKLTLHLPMPENRILLIMTAFGAITVTAICGLVLIILSVVTNIYFPPAVLQATVLTYIPWWISGLIAYFGTITIFVEPIWLKRLFMLVVVVFPLQWLLEPAHFNMLSRAIIPFFILALCFSISILYSGHRFRKGVRS